MNCMRLPDPMNGRVTDNTAYGSQANYTCDSGYTINGTRYRTCQCSGTWSGMAPECEFNLQVTLQLHKYTHNVSNKQNYVNITNDV